MKLNDKFIDSAEPGSYKDDDVSGLYIAVGLRSKTWFFVGKIQRKTVRCNLGKYPDISTRNARKIAKQKVAEAAMAAVNPNTEIYTIKKLFAVWCHENSEKKSLKTDISVFNNHLSRWDDTILSDLSVRDLLDLKNKMAETPSAFNRARALLSRLISFSRKYSKLSINNICDCVEKYPEQPRRVTLKLNDGEAFFMALDSNLTPADARDVIYVLIYVGLRPGEAYKLKKSWLNWDSGILTIPAGDSKNGAEMVSVVPDAVLSRLKKRLDIPGEYFFPPVRKPTGGRPAVSPHITSIRKALSGVCRRAGIPDIHPHDLRRTYGTWQLNAGVSIEVVSKNLHHADISITQKVYADILVDKQREGANAVRDLIDGIRKK